MICSAWEGWRSAPQVGSPVNGLFNGPLQVYQPVHEIVLGDALESVCIRTSVVQSGGVSCLQECPGLIVHGPKASLVSFGFTAVRPRSAGSCPGELCELYTRWQHWERALQLWMSITSALGHQRWLCCL